MEDTTVRAGKGRRVGDLTRKGRVEGDDAVAEKRCKRIVYSWL